MVEKMKIAAAKLGGKICVDVYAVCTCLLYTSDAAVQSVRKGSRPSAIRRRLSISSFVSFTVISGLSLLCGH